MATPFRRKGYPTSYEGFAELLGNRESRKLGNNTYIVRINSENVGIRLHNTYVVKFYTDGAIMLNSGGWQTVTTKDRINAFLPYPFSLVQEKHQWFIDCHYRATNGEGMCRICYGKFEDGMILRQKQEVTNV